MSDRPPAFRLPSPKNEPLFLFFGKGDYVIAKTAVEASCLWMDHFDDLAYAREFEQVPENEVVEIWIVDPDLGRPALQSELGGMHAYIEKMPARWWIETFSKGYLASTAED